MPLILPVRTQGFPQLLRDLGIITPQVGSFWELSTLISPTFLVGANAEVSATTARFPTDNYAFQIFVDPITNSEWGTTPELPRGRYQFKFNWFWLNRHATAEQTISVKLQPFGGGTAIKIWTLDVMNSALAFGRQADRGDIEFCVDLPTDGLEMTYVATGAGSPTPAYVGGGLWWHKYGDLPLEKPV